MAGLKLFCPKETTWGAVLEAARVAGFTFGSPKAQFDSLLTMKKTLKKKESKIKQENIGLAAMPLDPRNLPQRMFDAAYPDPADPPVPAPAYHLLGPICFIDCVIFSPKRFS